MHSKAIQKFGLVTRQCWRSIPMW